MNLILNIASEECHESKKDAFDLKFVQLFISFTKLENENYFGFNKFMHGHPKLLLFMFDRNLLHIKII